MTDFLSYFKETFDESREDFIRLARVTDGELLSHSVGELSFESLYLAPPSGKKKRLMILSSGIHGIEGFTGSALQRYFLEKVLPHWNRTHEGVLLIHGINPWGFKHERRVTQNNVDLNRNFDTQKALFKNLNPGYDKLQNFLNPIGPYSWPVFLVSATRNIIKYGMKDLRKAILKGQYLNPKGIFFGGVDFEPQVSLIQNLLHETANGYEEVLLVDLHTGYGEEGRLHLFGDRSPYIDPEYMKQIFKDLSVDYGQEEDFYSVTGGFTVYLAKLFSEKSRFAGIVFEFGTMNSHKALGSLDSLFRIVNENQKNLSSKHRKDFKDMFYPESPEWRKKVMEQFESHLNVIIKNWGYSQ